MTHSTSPVRPTLARPVYDVRGWRGVLSLLATLLAVMTATPLAAQESFPAQWAGRWEGVLTTTSPPDSVRSRIPITLFIAREDAGSAWTWRTVFNAKAEVLAFRVEGRQRAVLRRVP